MITRRLLVLVALFASPLCAEAESKALYQSPFVRSGAKERLHAIEIPLKKRDLYLVVSDEGHQSHDWANWLEPVLTMKDGTTIDLTTVAWKSATSAHGSVNVGKNCDGGPLKVAGKEFEKGIGTHADSIIHFKVPKGAVKFTAQVALDDEGADRNGVTAASVRFYVFDQEPGKIVKKGEQFDPNNAEPQHVPIEHFELPDDLEVTVWATSPLLFNPTNMDTDSSGRIWVAEGVNYRKNKGRRPEGDRIVVLEDKDRDGKAESSHTFVQDPELVAPLGISVFDNKVVVAQPPHLIVYTDVDRNLKYDPEIDRRENLLSGFNGKNHDHSLHAVVAGPGGRWYFNQGNCGANFKSKDGVEFWIGGPYRGGGGEWFVDNVEFAGKRSDDGNVWVGGFAARMNPDGTKVQIIGHGFRNSYEHTVTSFGDVFQNDNDDPPACRTTWLMEGAFMGYFSPDGQRNWRADQRPGQDIPRAHWRQDDPGTLPPGDVYGGGSPTGLCFYENGALPKKYEGLLASCEAARKVIFGYHPKLQDSSFTLDRFDFFKATQGNLFRPSDIMVGADGALYVSDWYDPGVGGHNDRDRSCSGTIYRIAPKGFRPNIPAANPTTIEGAVTLLRSPAQNVRFEGFQRLRKAGAAALPAIRKLLQDPNRFIRARAVWLLPFVGEEGLIELSAVSQHADPELRIAAFRAQRNAGADPVRYARTLYADPHPAVRRELAVSLRDVDRLRNKHFYVAGLLYRARLSDRTYLEACGLGAEGAEDQTWAYVRNQIDMLNPLEWTEPFSKVTWRLRPDLALPDLERRALSDRLPTKPRLMAVETLAFYDNPQAVDSLLKVASRKDGQVSGEATRWLIHLANTRWSKFGVMNRLKATGTYDPDAIKPTEVVVPEFAGESTLPPIKEILALQGNSKKGEIVAGRCVMCHKVEDKGVDFGPSLKRWVANQGTEKFLEAVIKPSAQIAHGFNGHRVHLKDQKRIDGVILSHKDPLIIQSQGGLLQILPRKLVEKVEPFPRSLMLSADQLGLSAQDLADLTSYVGTLK